MSDSVLSFHYRTIPLLAKSAWLLKNSLARK